MLSTLLNYRVYTTNMTKSLDRVQQTGTIAADAKYYEENIGKVETVDAFLDDYRLYTYALKAYGLEDQIASKGFIRKVIESDLSDKSSFANVLADERYRDLANAFDFKTGSAPKTPQTDRQLDRMIDAYSEHRVRLGTTLAAKTSAFERDIASVDNVDAFLGNSVLLDVSLRSIGVDSTLISKPYLRDILVGIASDNTATDSDDKFFALADRLNFGADGSVPEGEVALDAVGVDAMIYQYSARMGNLSSPGSAARETAYFTRQLALAKPIDDFLGDPRIVNYIKAAYVLPGTLSGATLRNVLTSDVSDPASYVNTTIFAEDKAYPDYALRLRELAETFDFSATGQAPAGGALTPERRDAVTDRYHDNYMFEATKADDVKISAFRDLLFGRIKSVSDLLADTRDYDTDAMEFALKAFDIDPASVSVTKVRRVLQSDVSDPDSYVNKLKDQRFVDLAAAFNFDSNGKIRAERVIQSTSDLTATGTLYRTSFGADISKIKQEVVTAETKRYLSEVAESTPVDDSLSTDFVVRYALTAYRLGDENLSTDELRKIFTSDMRDPESYANALGDRRYVDLVEAFNFTSSGIVTVDEPGVQSASALYSTQNLFLMNALEQQVGENSEGARLALYFLRKAPEATTTLQLLADKALMEVVRTALGLPDAVSQLDLDKQAALIEKSLDVKDLQDSKKLDAFIARFAALYDAANVDPTQSSPALALFGLSDSAPSGLLAML